MIMKKVACSDDYDHQSYNFTVNKMVVSTHMHFHKIRVSLLAYSGYQRVNNKNIHVIVIPWTRVVCLICTPEGRRPEG